MAWLFIFTMNNHGTTIILRDMPEAENNTFTLTLRGTTPDGRTITPGTISVGLLASFTENFRNLIQDDASEASIEEGSFKIVVFMTTMALSSLNADLENIRQGNYKEVSSSKRIAATKKLQDQAKKHNVEIDFSVQGSPPLLTLSKERPLPPEKATWFQISTAIEGKIIEIGGKTPNLHIEIEGKKVKVDATEDQIREMKENPVYQIRRLRVSYYWNPLTDEKKDFILQDIIAPPKLDREKLNALIEQGTRDWADVPDITAWVEDMRGGLE